MNFSGLILPLALAAADWAAVATRRRRLGYFTKPAAILALLGWLALQAPASGWGGMAWFGAALFASLAGDILLMLPRERFRLGLGAFLLAHLLYIIGLNQQPPPINFAAALILAGVAAVGIQLARRLTAPLRKRSKTTLVYPLLAYFLAIGGMVVSALWTLARPVEDWSAVSAILVSLGALSFFLSDTWLAWNRFITTLPQARLRIRIAYHLGQIGLALGASFHYWGT